MFTSGILPSFESRMKSKEEKRKNRNPFSTSISALCSICYSLSSQEQTQERDRNSLPFTRKLKFRHTEKIKERKRQSLGILTRTISG